MATSKLTSAPEKCENTPRRNFFLKKQVQGEIIGDKYQFCKNTTGKHLDFVQMVQITQFHEFLILSKLRSSICLKMDSPLSGAAGSPQLFHIAVKN